MSTPLGPAGWHPDPAGRFEHRYYNGVQWTADVAMGGQRFLDPAGAPVWSPATGFGPGPGTSGPSRGMAMAAFFVALGSLLLAWVPFVFVFAAIGAVVAFVFGVIGVRTAARQHGHGRGFAVWGIVLSVAAALLCIVGFALSTVVWRELDEYANPGPHTATITTCAAAADAPLAVQGEITNDDSQVHDYTITVEWRIGGAARTETVEVLGLAPGETATFAPSTLVFTTAPVECRIVDVFGPSPFGFPQGDASPG